MVELFFTYLGAIAEEKRYSTLARRILNVILRHLQEQRVPALSIGAFDGLGGMIYTLAKVWKRSVTLTGEPNRLF